MGPKKGKIVSVVKKTTRRRVVEETVQVVSTVVPNNENSVSSLTEPETETQLPLDKPIQEQSESETTKRVNSVQTPDQNPETDNLKPNSNQDQTQDDAKTGEAKTKQPKTGKDAKTGKSRKRKRNQSGGEEYRRYVYSVLRQVHPGMGISGKSMVILNGFMNDMFEKLAYEASKLTSYSRKKTMSSREIQGAVKLVLPGELGNMLCWKGLRPLLITWLMFDHRNDLFFLLTGESASPL